MMGPSLCWKTAAGSMGQGQVFRKSPSLPCVEVPWLPRLDGGFGGGLQRQVPGFQDREPSPGLGQSSFGDAPCLASL